MKVTVDGKVMSFAEWSGGTWRSMVAITPVWLSTYEGKHQKVKAKNVIGDGTFSINKFGKKWTIHHMLSEEHLLKYFPSRKRAIIYAERIRKIHFVDWSKPPSQWPVEIGFKLNDIGYGRMSIDELAAFIMEERLNGN